MITDTVIIGLGSNLGDSARILLKAWSRLGEHETVTLGEISSPYVSSPVQMESNYWFTNAVGWLKTSCCPQEFLDILMAIERELGRLRDNGQKGYQDRLVDLDLLYFGSAIVDEPRLTLPHPRLSERLFVLAPLASIAPEFIDPVRKVSIQFLYEQLIDKIDKKIIRDQKIEIRKWEDF